MLLSRKPARRGATLLEGAIIILVFLVLVFGMLDLSIGLMRFHLVSAATRHGARRAIVHGELAPAGWKGGVWGPGNIDVPATASGIPLVDEIRPLLVGMDPNQTRIQADWIDGANGVEDRVRITVTTPYQPMMTFIFGNPTFRLRASSTMPIAH